VGGRIGKFGRLTALQVQRLRKAGKHPDGGGLYFIIHKGGSRSWAFRYGRQGAIWIGLGPAHSVSLAEVRERAKALRLQLLDGVDPLAAKRGEKQAARVASARTMTFDQCLDSYHEAHKAGWRNPRHVREWLASMRSHASPILGTLPVADIDTALVCRVIEPLWVNKTATAARIRSRIEAVLDWSKVRGFRQGENPARWKGHLDHLLPDHHAVKGTKHFAALPYAEVPSFLARLREQDSTEARCLEFLILTAARLAQACEATWAEVNLAERTWTISGPRMKARRDHRVALSDRAMAILGRQRADYPTSIYVFPRKGGRLPLATRLVWATCKRVAKTDVSVHGFRSSFRDWVAEQTSYPREVAELALAHRVGTEVERAYMRSDLLQRRRALQEDWSAYCASTPIAPDLVVQLPRRRRG
jgi:integrase